MKIYNTLSRTEEQFDPLHGPVVTMYCCGPTVYDYTHIGHIRKYAMDDVLRRTLVYLGYEVKQVMNVTDVGHLTDDADSGEDKLEKGAKKTGKTVWEVAEFYTDFFRKTMKTVNVELPEGEMFCKATDHITEMIALIQRLQDKGHTYETKEAVYFDITTFSKYGALSGQKLEDKQQAMREDVYADPDKKYPADFALWFKRTGRFENHTMHWESPWGDGFPGWHIECSAMSMHYLGDTIDIHTGGIDHIPVHHENEIAQSEGATGKEFVKYWVHHNFLMVEGEKMSKSKGNFTTIEQVKERGLDPLSLRLLFLQTHYRQEMNFTWEAAEGANEALKRLRNTVLTLQKLTDIDEVADEPLVVEYREKFKLALSNDLETPQAVAAMWEMLKSPISSQNKLFLLHEFDQVFALGLEDVKEEAVPEEILALMKERDKARAEKNWSRSDELRKEIEEKGYAVEDGKEGTRVKKS